MTPGSDAFAALRPPAPGAPAYRQIEEQLHDLIDGGELPVGARIPPERELAVHLGVSRMTLRQALDALVRRGLLVRAGGRGTFVAAPKLAQDLRLLRTYADELRDQGVETSTRVIERAVEPASRTVARELQIARGDEVLRIGRLRHADGAPLLVETSWLPTSRVGLLDDTDVGSSLWDAMARAGAPVARAEERLEPIVAGAVEAEALEVPEGAPLMLVERVAFGPDGVPLEFSVGTFRGDRARFIVAAHVRAASGAATPTDR